MDAAPHPVPYRRIGTILVERHLITDVQLAYALEEQKETGRPLGEICVERYGLDRLSLADALAEQWEEMQRANAEAAAAMSDEPDEGSDAAADVDDSESAAEDELRVLLEEAEAARAELASKTDELSRRLAALETLVVGVSDALAELRPAGENGSEDGNAAPAAPQKRRASRRTAARR